MSIKIKTMRVSAICGFGIALLFAAFSLIFYFGDWSRLIFVSGFGFFIGLLGAPEIEPKSFKYAWLFQLFCGAVSGALLAIILKQDNQTIVLSVFIGAVLGWSAPFWVKHVQIT